MDDYYIGIDRDGQPYIAHIGFGKRKNTKYLQKIKEGAKTRYFYTKEQLNAYYNKGKDKAKEAVASAKNKYDLMKKSFKKNDKTEPVNNTQTSASSSQTAIKPKTEAKSNKRKPSAENSNKKREEKVELLSEKRQAADRRREKDNIQTVSAEAKEETVPDDINTKETDAEKVHSQRKQEILDYYDGLMTLQNDYNQYVADADSWFAMYSATVATDIGAATIYYNNYTSCINSATEIEEAWPGLAEEYNSLLESYIAEYGDDLDDE